MEEKTMTMLDYIGKTPDMITNNVHQHVELTKQLS